RLIRYAWLLAGTAAACLATPMLPGALQSALNYQSSDPMVASALIAEMQPFYHGAAGKVACLLVLIFTALTLVSRRRLRVGEWLWLGLSVVLLLRLGRFAPVFAIVAAPIFSVSLPRFSGRVLHKPAVCGLIAVVLLGGICRLAIEFPRSGVKLTTWLNRHGPDAPGYPCAAADFVAAHVTPRSGHIINEFSWGGYLEWRLGDRFQTLLDGRTQLFSPAFWRVTYLDGEGPRDRYMSRLHADAAVLRTRDSTFQNTLLRHGWHIAYRDSENRAMVLLPPPDFAPQDTGPWAYAAALLGE
ncbi:MAG TPA: hypothetical protein VFC78_03325, partial [Tepidisphaeraceae bacterium]|nr:hypothetical protein [Tepidisphaeraceae bacterium]